MATTILLPIDFSAESDRAFDVAAQMFARNDPHFVLLHVVRFPPSEVTVGTAAIAPSPDEVRALRQRLSDFGARYDVRRSLSVSVYEDVGAGILLAAEESRPDLIAMGTHGRGGIARAVLGSVADRVCRHAECPVLLVRALAAKPQR